MEHWIINIMNQFGYIGIAFLIAIENIFPPIPSEVILTFGGFMTLSTSLNISGVIFSSTIGATIGALILYFIGRLLQPSRFQKLIEGKPGKILRLKMGDIEKANQWFQKHGRGTVFFCRFIPIVRSLISIPAGMSQMSISLFLVLTTLGTLIWNSVLVVLGKFAGDSWEDIVAIFQSYSNIGLIILGLLVLIFFVYWFFIRRKRKA